jgi:hypothetical protein
MNKKIIGALGLYAFAMMASSGLPPIFETEDPNEGIKRKDHKSKPVKYIPGKGMRMFNINGVEVWAINEKNAIRKAKNVII